MSQTEQSISTNSIAGMRNVVKKMISPRSRKLLLLVSEHSKSKSARANLRKRKRRSVVPQHRKTPRKRKHVLPLSVPRLKLPGSVNVNYNVNSKVSVTRIRQTMTVLKSLLRRIPLLPPARNYLRGRMFPQLHQCQALFPALPSRARHAVLLAAHPQ